MEAETDKFVVWFLQSPKFWRQ